MNSASIVMQVLGLLVESVPGGQASTMVFYTNSLMFCSRTMRLNGGEGLTEDALLGDKGFDAFLDAFV